MKDINLEFGLWDEKKLRESIKKDWEDALIDIDKEGISLRWRYPDEKEGYFIAWERIKTKKALIHWLIHILPKCWELMTSRRIYHFIDRVCEHNRWDARSWRQ